MKGEKFMFKEIDNQAVNAIRALSIEQIEKANSGHPGLPMGAAPMAYALWTEHLNVNPQAADWVNRDRFILSAGHGSALIYSLLHLSGFEVTLDDLKDFRQLNSKTPGHPEVNHTHGVEVTTGPLGQGFAQGVGFALAETHTAELYNTDEFPVIDHYTYVLASDGDLMEGISYEASSFAGHQELDKLIVIYDSNDISLDGELDMAFDEDIKGRFEAQNWHYQLVEEGNDLEAISQAIENAKNHKGQPSMIEIKTVIGYGSPQQGTSATHGSPLGEDNWGVTREYYDWKHEAFEIPEEIYNQFKERVAERGQAKHQEWLEMYEAYKTAHPDKAKLLETAFAGELPENYDAQVELLGPDAKDIATRSSSGKAIQALASEIPYLWGGSADLSGSNKTMIEDSGDFMPNNRDQRNIWFGVREFAMAAMLNGVTLHGGTIVYGGTFFVFTDYLKPAVRLSAISNLPAIYVMTHDSVAVGEDGPTHEPVEQLAAFRAMPNLNVLRPADHNETLISWKVAVESQDRPTMLVLTRQNLPVLAGTQDLAEQGVRKGAYVISPAQSDNPDGIIIATGSEVAISVEAQAQLKADGYDVSVVSMPSENIFNEQTPEYKESVIPSELRNRLVVEMGASYGWHKYAGLDGHVMGIDRFGASGKGEEVVEFFGFTAENIAKTYKEAFTK